MKTKIFILTILCGLLSANETFAQNSATGGVGSPSPGTTSGGAINKTRSVEPGLNHLRVTHPKNPNNGFNRGVITNEMRTGAMTNGGMNFTNGFGYGSTTNRMAYGGLTNNSNGFGLVHTNNNGRVVNPYNPYANYTNPYATYTNKYATNRSPYATDPRTMERGGAMTNK